ncbi:MAG: ATP-binding protein [Bryobacteraceae bacterium]
MTPSPDHVDLSTCEREPIEIPGAIEPHGALLVMLEPGLNFVQVSANTGDRLGTPPEVLLSGAILADVFEPEDVDYLRSEILPRNLDRIPHYLSRLRVAGRPERFEAIVHRHQGFLILEVEPAVPSPYDSRSDLHAHLTNALAALSGAASAAELCDRMARFVSAFTGFGRVMIYRFLPDDSGEVVAEVRQPDLDPFLGLRYPASDIPAQARRLYLLSTLRLKPDVSAARVLLVPEPNPVTGRPLDMTYSVLRAMSPVHVEYLRNMGVSASMSISLIRDGRLWGLIACHHTAPKYVPHRARVICDVLARFFSVQIAVAEERGNSGYIARNAQVLDALDKALRDHADTAAVLGSHASLLIEPMRAEGAAFYIDRKCTLIGTTPPLAEVLPLIEWLTSNQKDQLFLTDRLSEHFAIAPAGLASVRIVPSGADFLLWFRPEVVRTVQWAGNPEKPVEVTEAGKRISPRRSFESWKESVRGRSEPWTEQDSRFALGARTVVAETLLLHRNDQIARLNTELERSNIELDSFAYAASHDLQEPLRVVRAYVDLLANRLGPNIDTASKEFIGILRDTASRMSGLLSSLLQYSQLGGAEKLHRKPIALSTVIQWVLMNLDRPVRESGARVTYDPLPTVQADQDKLLQLFQNLIGNALKYRRPEEPPRIHIYVQDQGAHWRFAVVDNGEGFDQLYAEQIFGVFKRLHGRRVSGSGIGLAICRRIVEQHGGRIWAESSPGRGSTFYFTLPKA